jgi:hypothetical protein
MHCPSFNGVGDFMARQPRPIATRTTPPDKVPETAIQDIARYQEQLLKMILHHDDRALRVLSLYVTVLGALVTAAFGLHQAHALSAYAGILMGGTALSLGVGCAFAYRAAWTARIFLPGRKSDFWNWALEYEQDIREAALAYAAQAVDIVTNNERVADRAATNLARAHVCGVAAPFIGTACAVFAYLARTYIT